MRQTTVEVQRKERGQWIDDGILVCHHRRDALGGKLLCDPFVIVCTTGTFLLTIRSRTTPRFAGIKKDHAKAASSDNIDEFSGAQFMTLAGIRFERNIPSFVRVVATVSNK